MDFQTFVKKYSFVDSRFINDFYNIIKEDYIEKYSEFLIDSELLRKWLNINIRRSFNDTIKRSYVKDIDYTIKTLKRSNGRGGQNFEVITLTPEASKKICLSTNSKKGKEVQQYFIDLEFALYKYKNYIIDGLKQKMNQLEINQKPKINSDKKIIYVFRALNTDLTLYKIGKTINAKTRFFKHNSPLANDLEILFQYETDNINQVESCIKALMKKAQYRKYKEIYEVDLYIIKKIIKNCDANINKINYLIYRKKKTLKGGKNNEIKNKIKSNEKLYLIIIPKPELLLNNIDKTKKKIIKLSEKQSKKKKKLFK